MKQLLLFSHTLLFTQNLNAQTTYSGGAAEVLYNN